ncbi:MAG TPA: hypothetical protein PLW10_15460 [Myxococcota bacterium]|nr:hypothetical protein [Myxococcota bacterium]
MRVLRAIGVFAGCLLGPTAIARAEDPPRTAAPGLEVRLSGTVGVLTNLADRFEDAPAYSTSPLAGVDLEDVPAIGFNAELGYRIHPFVSFAAHVEHLAEISVSVENGGRAGGAGQAGDAVLSGESWTLTGDLRAYVLTGVVQPYAVLGAGWMWADTDDEPVVRTGTDPEPALRPISSGIGSRQGFAARAGAGLDVYLNDAFFLNAQATYVVPVGRIRDFDYVSIAWGIGYRF